VVLSEVSTPSDNTWSFFIKSEASDSRTASSPLNLRQSESSSELSTQAKYEARAVPGAEVIVLRRLYIPGLYQVQAVKWMRSDQDSDVEVVG
jgi:hypothetical protein